MSTQFLMTSNFKRCFCTQFYKNLFKSIKKYYEVLTCMKHEDNSKTKQTGLQEKHLEVVMFYPAQGEGKKDTTFPGVGQG